MGSRQSGQGGGKAARPGFKRGAVQQFPAPEQRVLWKVQRPGSHRLVFPGAQRCGPSNSASIKVLPLLYGGSLCWVSKAERSDAYKETTSIPCLGVLFAHVFRRLRRSIWVSMEIPASHPKGSEPSQRSRRLTSRVSHKERPIFRRLSRILAL